MYSHLDSTNNNMLDQNLRYICHVINWFLGKLNDTQCSRKTKNFDKVI